MRVQLSGTSRHLHKVFRRTCNVALILKKIAFSFLLLLWLLAGLTSAKSSDPPLVNFSSPVQVDENVDKRPTLAFNPPDQQTLELEFPALTHEEIKITQTPQTGSGPLQVAFHRTIPNHIRGNLTSRLHWNKIGGTQYAYLQIRSPQAKTIRLELSLRLPKGASLRFYHVDSEGETRVGEKITHADVERHNRDTHWTTPVNTDHLSIEIRLPQGQNADAAFIELKNLSHGYISSRSGTSINRPRCSDHVQAPCAINRGDVSVAAVESVMRIRFERAGSGFQCSGALISDESQSTPFILTAAHCIPTATVASTLTPIWFHQASSCGSLTVDPRLTSTLGGGDLVAASSSLDMSLIRLRSQPPSGAAYATWDSTNTAPVGTDLIGIHHPEGYDKKFWKGRVAGSGNINICDQNGMNCILVRDTIATEISVGSTEPGSSGSPLFLSGTNTIVGVHFSSNNKCTDTIGLAKRFSAFYPLIENVLTTRVAIVDDHGDDLVSATSISTNDSTQGSIEQAGDHDWFSLYVPANGELTVFTRGTTNTAGRILDSSGTLLADDNGTHGGNFSLTVTASPETYYVDVSAVGNSVGDYQLITEFVENDGAVVDDHGDDSENATAISINDSIQGSIEEAGDQDWFSLEITANGILTVYTTGTTNTSGRILDSNGVVLAEETETHGGNFSLTINAEPGIFYIDVRAVGNAVGDYLLFNQYDDGSLIDDHGNDTDTATLVTVGQNVFGIIETEGDVDYFRLERSTSTQLIFYTEGSLDTFGQLLDENGEMLLEDDDSGTGSNFRIESELGAGIYFVKVQAQTGLTGAYFLHINTPSSDEPSVDDPGGTPGGDHGDTRNQATVVKVGSETKGTIDPSSDVDFFKVDLTEPGLLTIYTSGPTDTYGRLSSADGTIKLRDDDDGRNYNFHISADIHADTYFIEVTAYQDKTGDYVLHVEFEPWVLDLNSISLAVSDAEIEEHDQNQVTIFVNTDQPVRKDEIIELQLSGNATITVDYTIDSNEVSIPIGASQGIAILRPYRDWLNEGDEIVEITVMPPTTEPHARLSQVTLTIQDIFDEEGPVYQSRTGSDLIPLVKLHGGQDALTLVTTIYNVGSEESKPSSSVLSLHTTSAFVDSDELMRWETTLPELDSHGGSYRHEVDIDLTALQPDSTYYSRVHVAEMPDGAELITDNNTHHFGFALDENNHLKVRCEASNRMSTSENPDPLLPYQWHIKNTGLFTLTDTQITEGMDLNISQSLEAGFTGEGTTIAVIDTGLETCHPDLHTNVDLERSVNFRSENYAEHSWDNSVESDPFNPETTGDHGTSVAGLIAAIENNGLGGRGVASKARIRGFNYLQAQSLPNLVKALGIEPLNDAADIAILGFSSLNPTPLEEDLYGVFGSGTRYGRSSRGTLFVKAAGNSFAECGKLNHVIHPEIGCRNANSDAINNIPHVLVVGAVDAQGNHASYSSSGSNLWISAPSGTRDPVDVGLITTDQLGLNRGYGTLTEDPLWSRDTLNPDRDYMSTFIGTSGAAAQVGGAVALLLEVQPALSFRDIKHILATTAQPVEPTIRSVQVVIGASPHVLQQPWITNAAGYSYHTSFGFGAIDVDAAVEAAENWQTNSLGTFAVSKWLGNGDSISDDVVSIPDHDGAGVIDTISVEQPLVYEICDGDSTEHHCLSSDLNDADGAPVIRLEAVSIRLRISHPRMSDLGIHLTSPSGTESILNTVLNNGLGRASEGTEYFHFLSNAFYGENPFGDWKLKIVDVMQDEVGEILAWNLRFHVGRRSQ